MTLAIFVNILATLNLFLVSLILLVKSGKLLSNRLLSLVLLLPIVYYLRYIIESCGFYNIERFLLYPAQAITATYAPVIYAFVMISTGSSEWRHKLLFPISILLVSGNIILSVFFLLFLKTDAQIDSLLTIKRGGIYWPYFVSLWSVTIVQLLYFVSMTHRNYNTLMPRIKLLNSRDREWLLFVHRFVLLLLGLFVIQIVLYIFQAQNDINSIFVPFKGVLVFLFVFYKMFQVPEIFMNQAECCTESSISETSMPENNGQTSVLECTNERMDEEWLDDIYSRLIEYMNTERPYLDPEISLGSLAEGMGIGVHKLSLSINTKSGNNFFNFINSFRVEEAKRLLAETEEKSYSVEDVAYLSGFNSRASFYNAFKRHQKQTPTEYISQLQK